MTREQRKRDERDLYYEAARDPLAAEKIIVENEFDYDCKSIKNIMEDENLDFEEAVEKYFGDRKPWKYYILDIKKKIKKD